MESVVTNKICQHCSNPFAGRRDKKFCSPKCRFDFHINGKAKNFHVPFVRKVTDILIKNRAILQSLLEGKTSTKATKTLLIERGFNFKYSTHSFSPSPEKTYQYCFDYGYLQLKNDWCLIVKSNK